MDLRSKLTRNVQAFLEPGEEVQAVFIAQTGASPHWVWLTGRAARIWTNPRRIIVSTERAIVVLNAGKTTTAQVTGVRTRLPRQTMIGPPQGRRWSWFQLGDERMWTYSRWYPDIRHIDSLFVG